MGLVYYLQLRFEPAWQIARVRVCVFVWMIESFSWADGKRSLLPPDYHTPTKVSASGQVVGK